MIFFLTCPLTFTFFFYMEKQENKKKRNTEVRLRKIVLCWLIPDLLHKGKNCLELIYKTITFSSFAGLHLSKTRTKCNIEKQIKWRKRCI